MRDSQHSTQHSSQHSECRGQPQPEAELEPDSGSEAETGEGQVCAEDDILEILDADVPLAVDAMLEN